MVPTGWIIVGGSGGDKGRGDWAHRDMPGRCEGPCLRMCQSLCSHVGTASLVVRLTTKDLCNREGSFCGGHPGTFSIGLSNFLRNLVGFIPKP